MKSEQKTRHSVVSLAMILLGMLVLAGGVLVDAQTALGGSIGECMVERYNATKPASVTDLNCTSNDVQLAAYTLVSGPTSCLPGEVIDVVLEGEFIATSSERYDVGVFVATDGGNPNTLGGVCYNDFLHPVSADIVEPYNEDVDITGGFGPFYNAEVEEDSGDSCGDIEQGTSTFLVMDEISIVCQDSNNDGTADVGSCTVWANSASAGTTNKPSCIDETDTTAETTAKCTCDYVPISGLTTLESATITVNKVLSPGTDSGKFNLQIDGATQTSDVGDGGTTGAVTVSAGTSADPGDDHTVGEIAGTGTNLGDYDSTITCTNNGTTIGPTAGTSMEITVNPDENWVCTVSNTLIDLCEGVVCNDDNICTDDSCNPANGQCVYTPVAGRACDNSTVCDGREVCDLNGICQPGTPLNCVDSNICTDDSCNPASGCVYTPVAGRACDNSTVCDGREVCDLNGICQPGTPLNCVDSNICTDDSCNPASGCVYTPVAGRACDNSTVCDGREVCDLNGICQPGTPLNCVDSNICTDDSCNPASGCVYTPVAGRACDNSTVCDGREVCDLNGICQPGTPLNCVDSNICTDDSCNPASGCVYTNNTNACDDGNACTTPDVCSDGSCVGGSSVCICDVNADLQIDIRDTKVIFSLRGQPASACFACDADGNGTITTLDQKICISRCTNPNCRP